MSTLVKCPKCGIEGEWYDRKTKNTLRVWVGNEPHTHVPGGVACLEYLVARLQAERNAALDALDDVMHRLVCEGEDKERLQAIVDKLQAASADGMRQLGWSVAIHNDYRQNGEAFTFWLFTKDGCAVKGEGRTDAEAIREAAEAALKENEQ